MSEGQIPTGTGRSHPTGSPAISRRTPRRSTAEVRVLVVPGDGGPARERPDKLAAEEPMEIRVGGPHGEVPPLAVTMRTPGHDFELAVGFCVTEGILHADDVIKTVAYCGPVKGEQEYNIVTVRVRRHVTLPDQVRRFTTNASCGICGAASLDQVERQCPPMWPGPIVPRGVLVVMPERLRVGQRVFSATGGLHAAALFDAAGELSIVREDVGRHNAVDKVIGHAFLNGGLHTLRSRALFVSGRVSFEIVQKAAMAGIGFIAAVSAPSSLAVDAARRLGVTVAGFVRDGGFNVYSHPERIAL